MTRLSAHTIASLVPNNPALLSWVWLPLGESQELLLDRQQTHAPNLPAATPSANLRPTAQFAATACAFDVLAPLRVWLNQLDVRSPERARFICRTIPTRCPFERDIRCFGKTWVHIPPLCKLNPLYEEVVVLRFRALCYLADECGEDVTPYCE